MRNQFQEVQLQHVSRSLEYLGNLKKSNVAGRQFARYRVLK